MLPVRSRLVLTSVVLVTADDSMECLPGLLLGLLKCVGFDGSFLPLNRVCAWDRRRVLPANHKCLIFLRRPNVSPSATVPFHLE